MEQIYKHNDAFERGGIHRDQNEGRSHRWLVAERARPASAVSWEVFYNEIQRRGVALQF